MSDETVKRYEPNLRGSMIRERDGRFVYWHDYEAIRQSHEGLKQLLEQIRAALGIGPGTDVVRAAERARADRERLEWLEQNMDRAVAMEDDGELQYRIDWKENRSALADKLRDAIDAARRAEGEKA